MSLTTSQIQQVYDDWKGKTLNLAKMLEMYTPNVQGYVHFSVFVEFRRGGCYSDEGLLTEKEYKKIAEYLASDGCVIELGEVNGKHSDITISGSEVSFTDDSNTLEEYINEHGDYTDPEWFFGRMYNPKAELPDEYSSDEDKPDQKDKPAIKRVKSSNV
jgi:hypothetical protein